MIVNLILLQFSLFKKKKKTYNLFQQLFHRKGFIMNEKTAAIPRPEYPRPQFVRDSGLI